MGPEPIVSSLAVIGLVVGIAAFASLFSPRARLYGIVMAAPGLALAVLGLETRLGVSLFAAHFLLFFAAGSLIIGLPLAALLWFWARFRITKRGDVQ